MTFAVRFAVRVEKELRHLPRDVQQRMLARITALAENPFAPGTIKLQGEEAYRIRVGEYRIVFDIDTTANTVTVLKVGHRSDIYR